MPTSEHIARLFDHLVSSDQQTRWNVEVKRFRRFHVDGCLKFGRSLHRKFGGLITAQDAVDIRRCQPELRYLVSLVGHVR